MHVLIFSQRLLKEDIPYVAEVIANLELNQIRYSIYSPFYKMLQEANISTKHEGLISRFEELSNDIDMVLSLGGDGTILHAVTLVQSSEIPIAGINLGRLGFLAMIEKAHIAEAIQSLVKKDFNVQERTMIQLDTDQDLFGGDLFALNDFTIHKRDNASMIVIHSFINGQFLNSYWADGLVVSTPTGSTGYNLSGGGPIVFPLTSNFAITPIAPHNLNVRPIVISDKDELSFKIEGRDRNYLITLDARSEKVQADVPLTIRKCDWKTNLVVLSNNSFVKTIQNKLYWGRDSRN